MESDSSIPSVFLLRRKDVVSMLSNVVARRRVVRHHDDLAAFCATPTPTSELPFHTTWVKCPVTGPPRLCSQSTNYQPLPVPAPELPFHWTCKGSLHICWDAYAQNRPLPSGNLPIPVPHR